MTTRAFTSRISGLGVAFAFAACSPMIAQDAHSGADAKAKGAQKIRLGDDGEGVAKGIVTYPGGDRVDWKVFEVPKTGRIVMSYQGAFSDGLSLFEVLLRAK